MNDLIKQVQEACAKVSPNGLAISADAAPHEVWKACTDAIRALDLSHLSGWQPIETAPKDFVTEFDGWNGERVPNVCWNHPTNSPPGEYNWCVMEYESGWGWNAVRVENLSHWMPLPTPPKPSK